MMLKNKFMFFLLLTTYTLLLTCALLYYRFPTESVKLYCETSLAVLLPGSSCSIREITYTFPLSISMDHVEFRSTEDTPTRLLLIDQATIVGTPLAITSQFHVTMDTGGGTVSFSLTRDLKKELFTLENLRINHFNLENAFFLHRTMSRKITGVLNVTASYQRENKAGKIHTTGQGKAIITDGSFGLLYPILSLKEIDLQNMETDFVLQDKEMIFDNGSFRGKELTGSFSGSITLQPRFPLSIFSFRGEMEPLPPLLKKSKYAQNMIIQLKKRRKRGSLPFLLKGTIEKPKFHFDS